MIRAVPLPFRGVTNRTTFGAVPESYVPVGSAKNVRAQVGDDGQVSLAQRPGYTRLTTEPLGNGPVQELAVVTRASGVDGLKLGDGSRLGGFESRFAGAMSGQALMFTSVPSVHRYFEDARGSGTETGVSARWSPDGDSAAFIINDTSGGDVVCYVTLVNKDGSAGWTAVCEDKEPGGSVPSPARNTRGNTVEIDDSYVYVATVTALYVFARDDGTYLARYFMNGWCSEVVSVRRRPDGKIAALFHGAASGGNLPNFDGGQPINGPDYRSGIMLFSLSGSSSSPLTQEPIGALLGSGATLYEADHRYCRFSEISSVGPYGCYPTDLAIAADNSFVVSRTNAGWGPNGGYKPDATIRAVSVMKISAIGTLQWEADPYTNRDAYSGWWGTLYNDRADPTLKTVAINNAGVTFVAGRRNAGDRNVYALNSSGLILWSQKLHTGSGFIADGGSAINPSSQNPVFAGVRSTAWPGSSGANAHVWELDRDDGGVFAAIDIGEAVSALGVDVNADGEYFYVTDHFT